MRISPMQILGLIIWFFVLLSGSLLLWMFGSFIGWYLASWTGMGFWLVTTKPLLLMFFWMLMWFLFKRQVRSIRGDSVDLKVYEGFE